jgi:hypothetical protein
MLHTVELANLFLAHSLCQQPHLRVCNDFQPPMGFSGWLGFLQPYDYKINDV